jgi:hypothetical protein
VLEYDAEYTQTGVTATIPGHSRRLFTFPAKTVLPGTAKFQVTLDLIRSNAKFICFSGSHSDAAEISIPVYSPHTTEGHVATGDIISENDAILQTINIPANSLHNVGAIDVIFLYSNS